MQSQNRYNDEQLHRKNQSAINRGLGSNVFLALLKTVAGVTGNSTALLADGINSISDVVYYILVKIFMLVAGKPPDPEHPFGHRQMESIAALVVGAFVVTTALAIFLDSANRVIGIVLGDVAEEAQIEIYTLYIALFTVGIKLLLSSYTKRVAQKTSSAAILALAHDHRNDIFASLGAAAGISLGMMGFLWVDPLAGSLVALVIFKTGISILSKSSSELMGTVPYEELESQIHTVLSSVTGIREIEQIRAHRFGPYFVINITIGVAGYISVKSGDEIATEVENLLVNKMDLVQQVYVHYHPATGE
ncbi:cation diffusion facilitator family transporter [Chitinispirillum alkaliphilum]|nr:cation diffusion facilitator family transporter [Chitinispirillum alkaliphilum]